MIKEAIVKIVNKEDLTYKEAYAVMNEIMSGETTATECGVSCGAFHEERKGRDDRRDCRLCGGNAGTCHKGGDRYGIV